MKSCSVVSDSLRPHGLCSPWNSLGQNTGAGSLSLLHGLNPGLPHCRQILYQLSPKGSPRDSGRDSRSNLARARGSPERQKLSFILLLSPLHFIKQQLNVRSLLTHPHWRFHKPTILTISKHEGRKQVMVSLASYLRQSGQYFLTEDLS